MRLKSKLKAPNLFFFSSSSAIYPNSVPSLSLTEIRANDGIVTAETQQGMDYNSLEQKLDYN